MRKFFIVSSDNPNGLNGAAKFVKLMANETEFWSQNKINVFCYSNENIFVEEQSYRKSLKHKIKQKIKHRLSRTKLGMRVRFFLYDLLVLGKKPVSRMKGRLDSQSWVLLNDLRVAQQFYKKYRNKYSTIFIMHNSGDLLSMHTKYMVDNVTKKYLYATQKKIYENATKIVFVSDTAQKNFCENFPEYKYKTECIYIGLKLNFKEEISRDLNTLSLVMVGTVCERKNQLAMIEVLKEIKDKTIMLTIVGDGPMLEHCKKYVKKNQMEKQVKFTGPQANVFRFLQQANVFISTSLDEGLPVSAQEAMSVSLPLILTDVGGCRDLISNNGLLIGTSKKEIRRAVEYANVNKDKLCLWGKESKKIIEEKFSINEMLNGYLKIIRS